MSSPDWSDGREADVVDTVTAFARTVRAAGVPATSGRIIAFVDALGELDPRRTDDVFWAGRATLCATPDDLRRYDLAFGAFFGGEAPHRRLRTTPDRGPATTLQSLTAPLHRPEDAADEGEEDVHMPAGASSTETLRTRDLASLTPADRERVNRMLAGLTLTSEPRRTRRHRRGHRGQVDRRATSREALRGMGDPARLHLRRPRRRPRRLVLLVDISGSMSTYADALLRFAHVAVGRRADSPTEAFTIGTRLTRITRELRHRDPESAMAAVAGVVPDWAGGTRLADGLESWLHTWGQRGMARGAVIVVLSDGWERGDPAALGVQVERMQRLAHRVIWSNPRKASPGYAPLAGGMAAVLPHVDVFLSGHSVDALQALARAIAGADAGRPSPVRARDRTGMHWEQSSEVE